MSSVVMIGCVGLVPGYMPTFALAQVAGSGSETVETAVPSTENVRIFAGLRVWANQWDISLLERQLVVPDPSNPGSAVLQDSLQTIVSDTRFVPIPFVGIRAGKFLVSASYFPKTSYGTKGVLASDVRRSELDVNIGYYILPNVSVSLGYKEGKQDKSAVNPQVTESDIKVRAVLAGVSASVPLTDAISLYGNFAYGIGRNKTSFADAAGRTKGDSEYKIGELGFSYRLGVSGFLKAASLSLGYRAQALLAKDIALGTYSPAAPMIPIATREVDLRTFTDGFVIGFNGVF